MPPVIQTEVFGLSRDTPASAPGVFDEHLAEMYDDTRALSKEAMAQVVNLLERELRDRGRCLEIGVGTGRIALPLAAAGVEMVGIDPSAPMLARLMQKAGGKMPFPVMRADATALPFADATLGAALACHVLHLIPRWQAAIAELMRVTRRPGLILVDLVGEGRSGAWHEARDVFMKSAGVERSAALGVRDTAVLDNAMERMGASRRELPTILDTRVETIEGTIRRLESGIHRITSLIPDDVRWRAARVTRSWARQNLGDLDVPVTRSREIAWRAYDLP